MAGMSADVASADEINAPLTEAEIRAFVGRRADYYVDRWTRPGGMGANWAAFFVLAIWLPYRRMFRATLILFAVLAVWGVVDEMIDIPAALSRGLNLLVAIVGCASANRWYFDHATAKIREVRFQRLPEEAHLAAVASAGGTRLLVAFAWFVGLLSLAIAVVAVVAEVTGKEP